MRQTHRQTNRFLHNHMTEKTNDQNNYPTVELFRLASFSFLQCFEVLDTPRL